MTLRAEAAGISMCARRSISVTPRRTRVSAGSRAHAGATRSGNLQPLRSDEWRLISAELAVTPQQARIIELILAGHRDKQIARQMGVGLPTIRTQLSRVFERLGVCDRVELLLRVFSIYC